MDVSIIYTAKAVGALQKATRGHDRFSPVADIARSLSIISDALVNGHEFSETTELMPVEISTGDGAYRQFWAQISKTPEGGLEIMVPNANWAGGCFRLLPDVSDNRKVWKISHLELGGRSLDDR
ncbi:hypothetical protein DSM104299_01983 [Baekduia alba]|nr:hypothetical protein DSM104299_01983 [Baekduia alba]